MKLYSDIGLDGKVKINEDAIFNSVLNTLMTRKGERFFNPDVGSEFEDIIFELDEDKDYIEEIIKEDIMENDPRIANVEVNILNSENNKIYIELNIELVSGEQITKYIEKLSKID